MSSSREIECIKRMLDKGMHEELKEFLVEYDLISEENIKEYAREWEEAAIVHTSLRKGVESKKLQLVDYEWTLLPKEYIKLTVITENEKREFIHGL